VKQMMKFLSILLCAIILFGCLGGLFGLWHLVDSHAAERALTNFVAEVGRAVGLVGKGLLIFLVAASLGALAMGIGAGIRAGGEAFGKAVAFCVLSKEMAGQIERGNVQQADLPDGFSVLRIPETAIPKKNIMIISEPETRYLPPGMGKTEGM